MDRIIKPCNPVSTVAFGKKAIADLEIGPMVHRIGIEVFCRGKQAAGQALAVVPALTDVLDLIVLKANGVPQRTHTAYELDGIQTRYGAEFAAKIIKANADGTPVYPYAAPAAGDYALITIFMNFDEPWRKSYAAQSMYGLPTSWPGGAMLRSLQLELSIPNTGNLDNIAGNATPTLAVNCFAETTNETGVLDSNKNPVQLLTRFERVTAPYAGVGEFQIVNLLDRQDIYNQISLFSGLAANGTPDIVTNLRVETDGRIVRDTTKLRNDEALMGMGFNAAAFNSDCYECVFDLSDKPSDGLVMQSGNARVMTFKLSPTLKTADAVSKYLTIVSQIYGGLKGS